MTKNTWGGRRAGAGSGGRRPGAGRPIPPIGDPLIIDAMPAMADVVSGMVARPVEFEPGENPFPRLIQTVAWSRVTQMLRTATGKTPRYEPLVTRGGEPSGQWSDDVAMARLFLGEHDAIVVLFGNRVLSAFNADGTRAALMDKTK